MEESLRATQQTISRPAEVANISLSLRIPPFWRDRPRLWFFSFEAAIHELKKSQAQLAQMVIAQLDRQDIKQITDLLYNPPEADQYTVIKERLITVYEESDSRQFQKLLSEMELGDQKPSQLLRRMKDLARERLPDATLRLMWTNHLPLQVRSVLAVSESLSSKATLEELALLADKMMEQSHAVSAVNLSPSQSHAVSAVNLSPSTPRTQPDIQFLAEELRKLTLQVTKIAAGKHDDSRRSRSQSRNRYSRPRSRSSSPSSSQAPHCYYHRRFGAEAIKCTTPCSFKKPQEN